MFNGKEAFKKGENAVHESSITLDDYNEILPIFERSNQDATKSAQGDMDRTIEKCEKTIQLHSIVKKPKKNPKKSKDPKYKAFMAKEEYNSQVQEAWLLKGKALCYKLDYPAAEAHFGYVSKHFTDNVNVCTEAKLWAAAGYTEQGWYYEAEEILNRLSEKSFNSKTTKLFVLVKADLLIRQGQYEASLPFLEQAIELNKGYTKKRAMFIYAQVLEQLKRYGDAYNEYEAVKKTHTNGVMEFNAVLGMAKCYQGKDMEPILKEINKLTKRASNADYLDRIYYTLGQLYERNGDTDKAAEKYQIAIENSTRNGIDKAQALLALGRIYYDSEEYLKAQPLYAEAVEIIPMDHADYKMVQTRAHNLNYVAQYSNTVALQDSLLALSQMPEAERIAKVKAVIEQKHEEQAAERKKLAAEARKQELKERSEALAASANISLGENLDQSWYFYNNTLISKGRLEFQKTWGGRTLEDDWRRLNKVSAGFIDDDDADDSSNEKQMAQGGDTNPSLTGDAELDSYLKTIPTSEAQKKASNNAIEDALYSLYNVYENRINNKRLATETYNELKRRFPNSGHEAIAESDNAINDRKIEDIYTEAYAALKSGQRFVVQEKLRQAEECCSQSKLMPKLYMVEALSSGKADGKEVFRQKLTNIIEKYPDSDVTPLARDMVALIGQGKEIAMTGTSAPVSTIHEHREAVIVSQSEYAEALQRAGFEYDPTDQHSFIIVIFGTEQQKNAVLFAMAQYNFTRFMIKDYDFNMKKLNDDVYAVSVSPMSSLDEAVWYMNTVLQDPGVAEQLNGIEYKAFVISDDNFVKVFDMESLVKYMEFYQNNNLVVKESDVIKKIEEESGFVK